MKLAHAIRKNVAALSQAQNSYKENVVAVNTLITSVLTSKLPTLNEAPPDWSEYSTTYETAKKDAMDWINIVLAPLLAVPDEIKTYNDAISKVLNDATGEAKTLIAQPDNADAKAFLAADLSVLGEKFGLVATFVSGAVDNLHNFKDKMPQIAKSLQSIADKSTKDAGADQGKIDQLKAEIEQLRSDIKSLTATIVGLAIADGLALVLGGVATIALWPEGAAAWLLFGPAIAVATTFIGLDAAQIEADKRNIDALKGTITGITADVSALHLLASTFGRMAKQADALQNDMQAVLAAWQALQSDVNAAVGDIAGAVSGTGTAQYQAVLDDLEEATREWSAAYAQAGALHVELKVTTAPLALGMSSADVQCAMAQATTVGIIEYYNRATASLRSAA